jgi:hypothetical protein
MASINLGNRLEKPNFPPADKAGLLQNFYEERQRYARHLQPNLPASASERRPGTINLAKS